VFSVPIVHHFVSQHLALTCLNVLHNTNSGVVSKNKSQLCGLERRQPTTDLLANSKNPVSQKAMLQKA